MSEPRRCLPLLAGVDFTSRPTRRKPITVALGHLESGTVRLDRIESHATLDSWAGWLGAPGAWLGVFDLPFGLPRELVAALGWPTQWPALMRHYAALSRSQIRDTFAAFCDARPVGAKFAHRATDAPAGSSPSMKWVNPPLAFMLHAGVPLLIAAGVEIPGRQAGDPARVALEGYPGLLAREVLGAGSHLHPHLYSLAPSRANSPAHSNSGSNPRSTPLSNPRPYARSYKSDDRAKQTPDRLIARIDLIDALDRGHTRLGLRLKLSHAQRDELIGDASGDRLDAALCLMQAAWASTRANYGLPLDIDPIEGWIVSA